MALEVAVVTGQTPSSTGTQDFISSRITTTPLAAIFSAGNGESNGSFDTAQALLGFGTTDGTRHAWIVSQSDDVGLLGSTNTHNAAFDDQLIVLLTPAGVFGHKGVFNGWTNTGGSYGVQIDWTQVSALTDNKYVTCILLGDPDGDWKFFNLQFNSHATVNTAKSVTSDGPTGTSIGFDPEALILFGHGGFITPDPTSSSDDFRMSMGCAVNDGALTQGGVRLFEDDANANGVPELMHSNSYIPGNVPGGWEDIEITDWISGGFEVTTRTNSGNRGWAALAITSSGTGQIGIRNDTTNTSVGDKTYSFGFAPDFGMVFGSMSEAFDTAETDAEAGSLGVCVFDEDTPSSSLVCIEDAAATPNTAGMWASMELRVEDDDQTTGYRAIDDGATSSPFDSDGIILQYSAVKTTGRCLTMLALSEDAPPAAGVSAVNTGGAVITSKRVLTGVT